MKTKTKMKTKNNFSVYRGKTLIKTKLEQFAAHQFAKSDAQEQFRLGSSPTYLVKGTFGDGETDARIGTFKQEKNRMYWKFPKPN